MIVAHPVSDALGDAGVVGDHEAVPAPLAPQDIREEPFVHRCGNVVHHVERSHEAARSGIGRSLVTGHIIVEHPLVRHIHGVVVASGLGPAIEGKMLHAGHNLIRGGELLTRPALIAIHHSLGNARVEVRILAASLAHAAPAGIAGKVHHRTERPGNTVGGCLDCGNMGRFHHGIHIPAAGKAQWNGKGGLIAVDNVHAEDKRNAKAGFLHRNLLISANLSGAFHVEKPTNFSVGDTVFNPHAHPFSGDDGSGTREVKLADFLFQCHLGPKRGNETVHIWVRSAFRGAGQGEERRGGKEE